MRASLRLAAAWTPAFLIVAVFALEWLLSGLHATTFDNYVWLADAWLHHRLWIHFPGDWIDAVPFHGRAYVVEAPFPGILLVPLVVVFGTDANQTLVSAVVAAAASAGAWALARRAGATPALAALLAAFLALGTDVLYCGITGDVWLLAHVCAAAFSLFALVEMFGKRRGWVVAACAFAAAFSRYPLLLAVPVYAAWLAVAAPRRTRAQLGGFLAVAAGASALWIAYNLARWGTPLDGGYTLWYHVMDPRSNGHDPTLSLANLSTQVHLFLTTPPHVFATFPWVAPAEFGTALTFVCPGLLVALFAPFARVETRWLWLLAVLTAVPSLLYYDVGGRQLGTRHALDFEPFLFALVALALVRRASWWKLALVAYSVLAGAWLLAVWEFVPSAVF